VLGEFKPRFVLTQRLSLDKLKNMSKNITAQPKIVALKDFRLNAQSYISKVAKGESFVVVKRSRAAFRMEPIEEQWETVADFTKINKSGVDAKEILSALN
jgi:hypothetical protein